MIKYRITFKNEETGKTKSIVIEHLGIVPALEEAIRKTFFNPKFKGFDDILKVQALNL